MNDLEISRQLALAIGWKKNQMFPSNSTQRMYIFETEETTVSQSKVFDYRDPVIAFRVAERYDAFPGQQWDGTWDAYCTAFGSFVMDADTPQKAIAMAVINGSKK